MTATTDSRFPAAPVALISGPVDQLLFGLGGTLLLIGGFALFSAVADAGTVFLAAALLAVATTGPHYAATYRRTYSSLAMVRSHWGAAVIVPVVLMLLGLWALASPQGFAPLYFLGYVLWSGYHYSGQSLGIALIYPLRQGARIAPADKRLLAVPLYASWLLSLVGLAHEQNAPRNPAYRLVVEAFPSVRVSSWVLALCAAVALVSLGTVAVVARRRKAAGIPLPAASVAVILTQVVWFTFGLFDPLVGVFLVPVLHSVQYLGLVGWHHLRGVAESHKLRAFAAFIAVVAVLGLLINPGLAEGLTRLGYGGALATATAFTFINLHHFILDGRIWKLRQANVARSFMATQAS